MLCSFILVYILFARTLGLKESPSLLRAPRGRLLPRQIRHQTYNPCFVEQWREVSGWVQIFLAIRGRSFGSLYSLSARRLSPFSNPYRLRTLKAPSLCLPPRKADHLERTRALQVSAAIGTRGLRSSDTRTSKVRKRITNSMEQVNPSSAQSSDEPKPTQGTTNKA